ncbi:hypothetical protein AXG93_4012s1040 [Marchantia polymorpha subsp. ruderalis]|uniref:Uncharacterized protein n=1 Tax=Marchantia polymorpha subsp. ruderalis TaxID=1480154 RepID=A0A176VJS9_MARPO|nr:hypothetical protein AXG93_4012s1040 [Marchantia polymorpha subsp. ruderalis]
MLTDSGLSHGYWGEAIHTAVYLQNRSPSKALPNDKTPYELWHGQKPDLRHLQVFGCTAFAHIEKGHQGKIDPKSVECVFLGYSTTAKGYRVQRKDSHKILESRSVRFMPLAVREATSHHQQASVVPPAEQEGFTPFRPVPLAPSTDPVRRRLPAEQPPAGRPPAVGEFSPLTPSHAVGVPQATSTCSVSHPPTAEVPATSPVRFGQTSQRRTWKLRENPLSSAPLVDRVCNLVDLLGELRIHDTASEVPPTATGAASSSSRSIDPLFRRGKEVLMALAAQYNLEMHQMYVKTAFLNGVVDEEVYKALPEGLNISSEKNMLSVLDSPNSVGEEIKDIPYQAAVGSLMWAMVCTRPDISYAVSSVAQFMSNPGLIHWKAVKRIFRYLKGTLDFGLVFTRVEKPSGLT